MYVLQTGIILAGGNSTRMGIDKSMINMNVKRLAKEMRISGCDSVWANTKRNNGSVDMVSETKKASGIIVKF